MPQPGPRREGVGRTAPGRLHLPVPVLAMVSPAPGSSPTWPRARRSASIPRSRTRRAGRIMTDRWSRTRRRTGCAISAISAPKPSNATTKARTASAFSIGARTLSAAGQDYCRVGTKTRVARRLPARLRAPSAGPASRHAKLARKEALRELMSQGLPVAQDPQPVEVAHNATGKWPKVGAAENPAASMVVARNLPSSILNAQQPKRVVEENVFEVLLGKIHELRHETYGAQGLEPDQGGWHTGADGSTSIRLGQITKCVADRHAFARCCETGSRSPTRAGADRTVSRSP